MMSAIAAGKSEKSDQTMVRTDSSLVIVTIVSPVSTLVSDTNPAIPNSRAIKLPDVAPPNFCAIVPEEKINPVELVPFFSVA